MCPQGSQVQTSATAAAQEGAHPGFHPLCRHRAVLCLLSGRPGTELTSSFTLAAGDWSLALLLTWLFLPFSRSKRDLSFSVSSS